MSSRNALVLILGLLPTLAVAQTQGGSTSANAPNPYSRNSQTLSPYLNLLRGGNTAVNYFYGVRPNMAGGTLGLPFSIGPGAQGRQTFFPQIDTLYELDDAKPTDGIRPTGHPFGFNNSMGYYGSGQGNSNQQKTSGARRSTMGR